MTNESDFDEQVARLMSVIAGAIGDFIDPDSSATVIFAALLGAFAFFAGRQPAENRELIVRLLKANIPAVEANIELIARVNAEKQAQEQ
jgi:hypothetical protein